MHQAGGLQNLPQERETAPHTVACSPFTCTCAYARSAETQGAGQRGQDYVAWRVDGQTVAFALCDGVGESFYGDLAARFLGDLLVAWLWQEPRPGETADALQARLVGRLQEWTGPATTLVEQHPLPPAIPDLQRQALEQKRAIGSQTMFVAARVDLPTPACPQGRLILVWMGDCRLRLWHTSGKAPAGPAHRHSTAQRWSTRAGAVGGPPHLLVRPVRGPEGELVAVAAYSDGLAELDAHPTLPGERDLQRAITQSALSPASDDASYVAFSWAAVPAPLTLRAQAARPTAEPATAHRLPLSPATAGPAPAADDRQRRARALRLLRRVGAAVAVCLIIVAALVVLVHSGYLPAIFDALRTPAGAPVAPGSDRPPAWEGSPRRPPPGLPRLQPALPPPGK